MNTVEPVPATELLRCSRCHAPLSPSHVVYGDNDRKYCGLPCAFAQLDFEQGHSVPPPSPRPETAARR